MQYFKRKKFFHIERINGCGQIYIEIEFYQAISDLISRENQCMLKLKITPTHQRVHIYKFVMNYHDLLNSEYNILPIKLFAENFEQPLVAYKARNKPFLSDYDIL
jgi:hypothetical protein